MEQFWKRHISHLFRSINFWHIGHYPFSSKGYRGCLRNDGKVSKICLGEIKTLFVNMIEGVQFEKIFGFAIQNALDTTNASEAYSTCNSWLYWNAYFSVSILWFFSFVLPKYSQRKLVDNKELRILPSNKAS